MNTSRTAEAIILLDIIYTINSKSHDIEETNMVVTIDNQAVQRMVYGELTIPNHYN